MPFMIKNEGKCRPEVVKVKPLINDRVWAKREEMESDVCTDLTLPHLDLLQQTKCRFVCVHICVDA